MKMLEHRGFESGDWYEKYQQSSPVDVEHSTDLSGELPVEVPRTYLESHTKHDALVLSSSYVWDQKRVPGKVH